MSEAMNSRILGLGHYVPERVVTNAEMTRLMDTSNEWIRQRTGIEERHFISADTGPSDLALPAAEDALRAAGVKASELDLIMLATLSPDIDFPSSAALLQRRLGVSGMPAMDVRNVILLAPGLPEEFSPLLGILPLSLLAFHLARLRRCKAKETARSRSARRRNLLAVQ